ncbi:2-oxoacid:acceptor oxidoreductase family protein [Carboxydothermus ferrireducens]|uniref:2-oxoglutarate ferredoxin oxidoreductase subunit gamma n=1 Tax=Carboxydothermus ferrireducens DSM 11255 TaxID=1119529 RepID=A0ABX2RBW3_9THEO|nr:2-oxoacid:acceptor oxidoreductase family protein [Carboxydothermus ferrireducens]NYE58683.1 2-oxoglutarate ferredoxin oxidoreductase subunit gamma [Carboxydothermus ferrireducens DSM 11255]
MGKNFLMAGFGGQGVLLMGEILAKAALLENKGVSWLPAYGPEMRGGTANCAVVIEEEGEVVSPLVFEPEVLVAFNKPSYLKFLPRTVPGGIVIVNSDLVDVELSGPVKQVFLPANQACLELGSMKAVNIYLLGALIALTSIVKTETISGVLKEIFGPKGVYPLNEKAFWRGYEDAGKRANHVETVN